MLRVYFIGNSVTDTVRHGELAKLAAARDENLDCLRISGRGRCGEVMARRMESFPTHCSRSGMPVKLSTD